MDVVTRSIAVVPWADAETVFGTRGDPATCWCQYFKMTNAQWKTATRDDCRDALREQAPGGPGLIAYLDGEPVGWVAIEPRTRYSALLHRKAVAASQEPADADDVWAITCLVVRVGFRRRGVGGELVTAAVDHARSHGARVVEAYPVDTTAVEKTSSAELYHGVLSTFEREGFSVVARPTPSRAVVVLKL